MDNQPNSDTEVPVYTSTDIASTKARTGQQYFTNVQKASPFRKFSEWFAKKRAANLEASQARQAAFKAKRAERRRQADIAALSREVPTMAPVMKNARGAAPQQFPAAQPQPTPTAQPQFITPTPQSTIAQPTPQPFAATPAASPKPTTKKTALILAAVVGILIIIAIIILIIMKPWDAPTSAPKPQYSSTTGTKFEFKEDFEPAEINMATATSDDGFNFLYGTINSTTLDVYNDVFAREGEDTPDVIASNIDKVTAANNIEDEDTLLLFELEKARIYTIYKRYDSAWQILGPIQECELLDSQIGVYYKVMAGYYSATNKTELAATFQEKYGAVPSMVGGGA